MWYFTFRKQIIIRLSILNKCSVTKNHKSTNHSISNWIPMVAKCYNVGKIPQNRHLCRLVSSILLFLYNCNILCKLINHFGRMKSDRRWHIRSDNLEFHNSFRKNVNQLWIYVMPVIFFCHVKSVFMVFGAYHSGGFDWNRTLIDFKPVTYLKWESIFLFAPKKKDCMTKALVIDKQSILQINKYLYKFDEDKCNHISACSHFSTMLFLFIQPKNQFNWFQVLKYWIEMSFTFPKNSWKWSLSGLVAQHVETPSIEIDCWNNKIDVSQ